MNKNPALWAACVGSLLLGLSACDNKGPVAQVGEEIDEAVDTARHGEESTSSKMDDAVDDVREGAKDAADELKSN